MRIGIYAPYYHPFEGGAERVARRVATALAEHHSITVFTLRYDTALPAMERDADVQVIRVPYNERRPIGFTWLSSAELVKAIREENCDVLQLHGATFPNLALQVAWAARRSKVPTVLVPHGLVEAYEGVPSGGLWRRRLYHLATRPLLAATVRLSSHIALTSTAEGDLIRRLGGRWGRTTLVYNGFEPPRGDHACGARFRREHNLDDAIIIVHVATLKPNKGHLNVLDALSSVIEKFPGVFYVSIGSTEGLWREFALNAKATAVEKGVASRSRFVGHVPDDVLFDAYAAADIVVVPSLTETFPLAVLDAVAWGKAIVATRVGGIPEIITDGENGLLVPAGDTRALTRALFALLEDPALRRRLAAQARSVDIERFSWERVFHRYETICADLTAGRARSAHRIEQS